MTPPIGKAPNDGGGEMEERVEFKDDADFLAHVRDTDANPEDVARFHRIIHGLEQERDTLKSKLSEAEKALENIASWREACHEYDEDMGHPKRDFDVDDVVKLEEMAAEALSRLRADGGKHEEEEA